MAAFVLRDNARLLNRIKIFRKLFNVQSFALCSFQTKTHSFEGDNGIEFDQNHRFFESKKIGELARALFVLKLSSYDLFVKNSLSVSYH
jgi:hypothetical protein